MTDGLTSAERETTARGKQHVHAPERRSEDRRRKKRFVRVERRSGFDRRRERRGTEAVLVYLRDNPQALLALLLLANLLSVLDLVFTLHALNRGALEGNPLMRSLLEVSPAVAAAVKLSVFAALSAVLWWLRRYRLVLLVVLFTVTVYSALIVYQVYGLMLLR